MAIGSPDSATVLTLLMGAAAVGSGGQSVALTAGGSAVVWPAAAAWLAATAPLVALRSWVPHLREEIVARANETGAAANEIAALGGPLDDVRAAMDK